MIQGFIRLLGTSIMAVLLTACGGGGGGGGGGGNSTPCTNATVTNLELVSSNPSNAQSNVSVNTAIELTFNTCVNMSSVNSTTTFITEGGASVSGSFSFDGTTRTLRFTPSAPFSYGASVVVLLNGVTGTLGEVFAAGSYGMGFFLRATPDTTAPTSAASVAGGSYNTAQSVSLSCTDEVDGTGCDKTYFTTDGSTPTTASAVYSTAIDITATTTLKFFSTDMEGNSETIQTVDYIIDTVPPTVDATTPAGAATGVLLNSVVMATFSEAMDETTLTAANITVDNGVKGTLSYNAVSYELSFTPNDRMTCNTLHSATIGTGVQDLAGNNLAADHVWSFTTHTDCAEPETTATITSGIYTSAQDVTLNCSDGAGSGCARIVYTTDGSAPSFSPVNGTVVAAASTGPIAIALGDTRLRYYAEDNAGNREALHEHNYSVSTSGFTYISTDGGLSRGAGTVPTSFVNIKADGKTFKFFEDTTNMRRYRTTSRGIFFSEDGGSIWNSIPVYNESMALESINGMYAVGSRIYAASSNGLFVSTNGGTSFEKRYPAGAATEWCYDVVVTGVEVYLACSATVMKSTDKGTSFTVVHTVGGGMSGVDHAYGLTLDSGTLYVATSSGLAISTDNGASFAVRTIGDGLGSNVVNDVFATGAVVYAASNGGLSISTDSGASFANRTTGNGLGSNSVTGVTANGANVYATTGTFVSYSTDSGASFGATSFDLTNPDSIALIGGTLHVGAYPSYYTSVDGGVTFTRKGLPTSFMGDIAVATDGTLYVQVEDSSGYESVAKSTDGGFTFSVTRHTDWGAFSSYVDDLFVDGTTLYIAGSGLTISSDGAATFANYDTASGMFANSADAVWASGTTIYVNSSNSIDVSTTATPAFSQVLASSGSPNGDPNGLAVDGTNIYLATTSGLQVSNNSGTSFGLKTIAHGLPADYLTGVVVDGSGNVYVSTLNNGVAKSTDNGASFALLRASANRVSMCNNTLYINGTALNEGMGISSDGGATFTFVGMNEGLGSDTTTAACYIP